MKDIRNINEMQTLFTKWEMEECVRNNTKGAHESILRAYNILEVVKEMLNRWDSVETIQWIIKEMEYVKQDLPQGLN